jgi:hypothetical protein
MKAKFAVVGLMALATVTPALAQRQFDGQARPPLPASSTPAPFLPNAVITESFDTVAVVSGGVNPVSPAPGVPCSLAASFTAAGWVAVNNSTGAGAPETRCITQGFPTEGDNVNQAAAFPAQAGAATSYAGMPFVAGTGVATLSTWLISPVINFGTGAALEFWTRAPTFATTFPDRLQVRLSTASGTPDVGNTPTSVGTFTTLLLDVNPTLVTTDASCTGGIVDPAGGTITGYPLSAWCRIRLTNASGIPTSGSGRIAFRYFVPNGGPGGANSFLVGIDTFSFDEGQSGTPGLSLAKRVQTSSNAANCATAGTTLTVPAGTQVYYCYQATNTGTLALQTHNLTDTAFGTPILTDLQFPLAPSASSPWVVSPALTVTQQTSSAATWSACAQATNCTGATPATSATATVAAGVVTGLAQQAVNTLGTGAKYLFMLILLGIGLVAMRRLN